MISIIVCTYNSISTIGKCIKSINLQEDIKKEVIVIDANSTDGTLQFLEKKKSDIKIIKNKKRISLGIARERGIKEAKGKYVVFVDSDVVLTNNWCKKAYNLLESDIKIGAVGGPGTSPFNDKVSKTLNLLLYGKSKKDKKVFVNSLPTMDVMYRKEAIEGLNFDKSFWMGEDVDFSFKIIERGYKLLFSQDLWVYHYHPTTLKKVLVKWYRYGLFYRFPYLKHKNMKSKVYYGRLFFVPIIILFFILAFFSIIFYLLLILHLVSVFIIYFILAIRIVKEPSSFIPFIFIQSFKQYAQLLGIFVSLIRGNKSLGVVYE